MSSTEKNEYKQTHYKKLAIIRQRIGSLHAEYPDMKFAIENPVIYKGHSDEFNLYHEFPMIGRNEHTVLLCIIQPQLNALNINQTILNAAFYIHLARNSTKSVEDGHRFDFHDKRVRMCVLSFDKDPFFIDLPDPNDHLFRSVLMSELRVHLKRNHSCLYNMLTHIQNPHKELRVILNKLESKNDHYIKRYITALDDQLQDAESPETYWEHVIHDENKFMTQLEKRLDRELRLFFEMD
jgi:hypothetical protein